MDIREQLIRWLLAVPVIALILAVFFRNSIIDWFRSRSKPIVTEWATLEKRNYQTGGNAALVGFHLEREEKPGKLTVFECGDGFIARLPEAGTRGKLTHRGRILYSFSWPGETLTLNEPPADGVRDDTMGMFF